MKEVEKQERKPESGQKAVTPPKKKGVGGKNEEFKKRYFAFYDDIKISDREDW